ncbi:MAG: ATP synthase F1 subunit delta [Owenweeksia sp.]
MAITKLGRRYAKSLLDLSEELGKLEEVKGDIEKVLNVIQESKEFRILIKSPIISADKKIDIYHAIFKDQLGDLTSNFIDIITRKRRESHLQAIVLGFQELYRIKKDISKAVVTTAVELSDAERAEVKAKLAEATGQQIEMDEVVDSSLIGGIILRVGDKRYNGSISHQLDILKRQFKNNLYVADY